MEFADDCGLLLDLCTNGGQRGGAINQGKAVSIHRVMDVVCKAYLTHVS